MSIKIDESKASFYKSKTNPTKPYMMFKIEDHAEKIRLLAETLYLGIQEVFEKNDNVEVIVKIRQSIARMEITHKNKSYDLDRIYFRGLVRGEEGYVGIAVQYLYSRGNYIDLFYILDISDLNMVLQYFEKQYNFVHLNNLKISNLKGE